MELTRRGFVAGACAAGAAMASACTINMANAVEVTDEGAIFAGRARGMRGHIGVHVTLADGAITAIDVVENTETPEDLSLAVIASLPQAMIDAQSVNVDALSGATLSSMALISAVRRALEAAGVADGFDGPVPAADAAPASDDECDVLVIGSGLAGTSAAVAASYAEYGRTSSGLKVVIAEKQGFTGGSSRLAGGTFCALQPLDSTANIDRLFADEFPGYYDPAFPIEEGLARNMLEISGKNALQMQRLGFPFVSVTGFDDPAGYDYMLGWYDEPRPNPTVFGEGVWSFAGYKIMRFMDDQLSQTGVDVRLNTAAKELVVEDGAVVGAVLESPAGAYTMRARKTVIATGGICRNPDLIAEYCPTYVNAIAYANAGCTGDGIALASPVGAVVDGFDACGGPLGVDVYFGAFNDMGYDFYQGLNFPAGHSCVVVNKDGRRFMTDGLSMEADEHALPRTVLSQPDGIAWSVFDSANPAAVLADASVMQESIFRADTLAELAELIEVPADALVTTIDAFNDIQASGADDAEFGVANADMLPVTTAPFYAVACHATICYSGVGLRVGEHCEVVNGQGDIIGNLYACGEAAYTGNSLTCLGGAMMAGRLVGDHARQGIVG